MKKKILKEDLFFSMTWDYLNIYLPTQHQDSPKTVKAYTSTVVQHKIVCEVLKTKMFYGNPAVIRQISAEYCKAIDRFHGHKVRKKI